MFRCYMNHNYVSLSYVDVLFFFLEQPRLFHFWPRFEKGCKYLVLVGHAGIIDPGRPQVVRLNKGLAQLNVER